MHFQFGVALELIQHLRAMGETNALLQRNNVSLFTTYNCSLATEILHYNQSQLSRNLLPSEFLNMADFEEGDSFSNCCSVPVIVWSRGWDSPCNFSGKFMQNIVNVIINRKKCFPSQILSFFSRLFLHLFNSMAEVLYFFDKEPANSPCGWSLVKSLIHNPTH